VAKPQTRACVEYSIALSQIYRVPVLYFNFVNVPMEQARNVDTVYEHLVPSHFKDPLKEIGVMGGISMQNHPVTGRPSFFIHPCNTPTAMEAVSKPIELTPENYLMVWLGVVGSCVGLDVPFALGGQTVAANK
jgi:ubiquitin-like-conjugating enzyme ATG10